MNMNPYGLLWQRIKKEWRLQSNVVKTAVDWTVGLYIIIPLAIYGIKVYIDWWHHDSAFFMVFPFKYVLALPLFLILSGNN